MIWVLQKKPKKDLEAKKYFDFLGKRGSAVFETPAQTQPVPRRITRSTL